MTRPDENGARLPVTVIGLDGDGLSAAALHALAEARLVVGGRRHLDAVPVPPTARTVVMGDVGDAVAAVRDDPGPVVVLASGDPGFFGIVRRLRSLALPLVIHPAVSSVALAFARIGVEWDDAQVVSVHGRDPRAALAVVRTGRKLAVLTDAETGPSQIAQVAPAGSCLVVLERLGERTERVVRGTPHEIAAGGPWQQPNVVLVLNDPAPAATPWQAGRPAAHQGWALPDSEFVCREGMITKSEVRAHALARLAPAPGQLIWDIGAGSGSVAVECARLGAAVLAVERDEPLHLRENIARHGVQVEVVHGCAPAALVALPDADAAFVGGGGLTVVAAVAARRPRRLVVTLATVERVGPVLQLLTEWQPEAVLLQASRLQPLADGHRLVPLNPVVVVSGVLS